MHLRFLIIIAGFFYLTATAKAQDTTFLTTYGGMSQDQGRSVIQTSDSGFILLGSTSSFGYGNTDVYLIKTDTAGTYLWSKTYGGTGVDWGMSVQETADKGLVITGYTNSFGNGGYDVYLLRTDSAGDTLWTKTYGGADWDFGYSVKQTSDGGYIICGETYSFGKGLNDVYLIKTDANGNLQWSKTYGDNGSDYGYSVKNTFDQGFVLAGGTNSFHSGDTNMYVIKVDGNGDTIWTKNFGWNGFDEAKDVQQSVIDSGYVIIGTTDDTIYMGGKDILLSKLDQTGNLIWSRNFGGIKDDIGNQLIQRSDGYFILACSSLSFGAGENDFIIYFANPDGYYICGSTFGLFDDDICFAGDSTYHDGYIFIGSTESWGQGFYDIMTVKIDSFCAGFTANPTEYNDPLAMGWYHQLHTPLLPFPNPTQGASILRLPSEGSGRIRITNVFGETVKQLFFTNQKEIAINLQGYPSGFYAYTIYVKNQIYNGKLILR